VKGVFVPLAVLSFATILIGTINYGMREPSPPPPLPATLTTRSTAVPSGHVSPNLIYYLFWVYVSLSLLVCFPMLMIWFNKPHDLTTFTPAWAFLIFPMMLVGVIAFNALKVIPPEEPRAIGVLLVGYAFQGLGTASQSSYPCGVDLT